MPNLELGKLWNFVFLQYLEVKFLKENPKKQSLQREINKMLVVILQKYCVYWKNVQLYISITKRDSFYMY